MEIRLLGPGDAGLLAAVAPGLFDNPVNPAQARAFLASPLNELALGLAGGTAVAFASGTLLLHPDKPPSLFVNEVGTREGRRRRGHGTAVVRALMARARARGCRGLRLGTEPDNVAALALCRKLGRQEMAFVGFGRDGAFDAG